MIRKLVTAVLILISAEAFAQTNIDSLEFLKIPLSNSLTTNFDKLLNTYALQTRLFYFLDLEKTAFSVHENYRSSFLRGTQKSIRDEHYLSLSAAYKIMDLLRGGLFGNNVILSDDRKIEINQSSISDAGLFLRYTPVPGFDLLPYGGYTTNRQVGEIDNGPIYGGEGLLDKFYYSDFLFTSALKFRNEDISPRRNLLRYFSLNVNNNFEDNVYNNIDFNFSLNRKDFYYEADSIISNEYNINNNIQSRTETGIILQDRLQYFQIGGDFSFDLLGRVGRRIIDRDTRYKPSEIYSSSVFDAKVNENNIDFEGIGTYRAAVFSGTLRGIISQRDEKHQARNYTGTENIFYEERSDAESQKNNVSTRASLSVLGSVKISPKDMFYFSILQNKLRYDTPSESNFDDRDELLTIIRFKYSRLLSPFFTAFVNAEGSQAKTVYIYSDKSSNNNVNRVIRFSGGGDYKGKNVSSFNIFEVTANYTVYDYEDLNPNYQSYSFRQFSGTDSSYVKLGRMFAASVYGYIKLSEQGNLRWASFSTVPTRFLREIYAEPKMHLVYPEVTFSLGMRIFSLYTYNYNKRDKILDSRYTTTGPLAEILYIAGERLYLRFYGWYEFIKSSGANPGEQANLNLQMTWNI